MKIANDFILREIAGEYIIVPTGSTALNFNGLITVNEVGLFLWKKLEQGVTREELLAGVLEEYEIDAETAKKDIDEFLNELKNGGILTE